MNRRFGQQPDPARRYTPRPGVYAVIRAPGGVLLTFQEAPEPEFQLPGGGIDPGEAPLRALHREVMEETGFRIHAPRRLGMFHSFKFMPDYDLWAQKLCHVYVARIGRRDGPPREAGHWPAILPLEEAQDRVAAQGDGHFLRLAAVRRFYENG